MWPVRLLSQEPNQKVGQFCAAVCILFLYIFTVRLTAAWTIQDCSGHLRLWSALCG